MRNIPASNESKILRELLAKIHHEKKIQQSELAKRINKPQSFVSKYETGERRLEFIEVMKICFALEVMPELFIKEYLNLIDLDTTRNFNWSQIRKCSQNQ